MNGGPTGACREAGVSVSTPDVRINRNDVTTKFPVSLAVCRSSVTRIVSVDVFLLPNTSLLFSYPFYIPFILRVSLV
jgi:hypothetical protein